MNAFVWLLYLCPLTKCREILWCTFFFRRCDAPTKELSKLGSTFENLDPQLIQNKSFRFSLSSCLPFS